MSQNAKENLILVGMPGSGKSTLSQLVAERLGWQVVDTDALIERRFGAPLQQLLDRAGYLGLRQMESEVIRDLACQHCVIATGGSVVYSEAGMQHLQQLGTIVYLAVSEAEIRRRITNWDSRGIAAPPGTSLHDLYAERVPLYERYAHRTVHAGGSDMAAIAQAIVECL